MRAELAFDAFIILVSLGWLWLALLLGEFVSRSMEGGDDGP